jgi:hypothetical protein
MSLCIMSVERFQVCYIPLQFTKFVRRAFITCNWVIGTLINTTTRYNFFSQSLIFLPIFWMLYKF